MEQPVPGGAFDHPPSPEELAAVLAQSEENDPRSIFYKRVLVRPKLPVVSIILFVMGLLAAGVVAGMAVCMAVRSPAVSVLAGLAVMVMLALLFAKPVVITAVRIYQAIAPARVRKRCRYEPSCSQYMILAIEKYGVWTGCRKGLRRWNGCKPPNGGYDEP